jgi:hypothetical protein
MIMKRSRSGGSPKTNSKTASGGTSPTEQDGGTIDPPPKLVGKPASKDASDESAHTEASDPSPVRWGKRVLAIAGAIASIGGTVAVLSQTTHLLSGLTHNSPVGTHSSPPVDEIERSPILGTSFYQNGNLDPMSYSYSGQTNKDIVSVSMQSEPFELWFPALSPNSVLAVCASASSVIFNNAIQDPQNNDKSCLNVYNAAADFQYASGGLVETSSQYIAFTAIGGSRAQPASGGDEKYYVSQVISFPNGLFTGTGLQHNPPRVVSLTNEHGKLYLVIYLNTNNFRTFQDGNVEDFTLTFG